MWVILQLKLCYTQYVCLSHACAFATRIYHFIIILHCLIRIVLSGWQRWAFDSTRRRRKWAATIRRQYFALRCDATGARSSSRWRRIRRTATIRSSAAWEDRSASGIRPPMGNSLPKALLQLLLFNGPSFPIPWHWVTTHSHSSHLISSH